jgi:hypothetical protein
MCALRADSAAGVLGFAQPGLGLADFTVEPGEQPGLAALGVGGRVLTGPSGVRGDLRAQ